MNSYFNEYKNTISLTNNSKIKIMEFHNKLDHELQHSQIINL